MMMMMMMMLIIPAKQNFTAKVSILGTQKYIL